MSVRVVLADDHKMFLDGIAALLMKRPDIEVVAQVKDGREAVKVARREVPDVVLMDISMPGMNGIEATRLITSELPGVKVLCLSMHSEERYVSAAFEGGASGFLLKDCAFEELLRAVETVHAGHAYLSPPLARLVIQGYTEGRSRARSSAFSVLTNREREVLQLIAEGHGTKEIASRLGLSVKTIGTHREHIMAKLNIRSIAGLTKYAVRHGLTTTEPHLE